MIPLAMLVALLWACPAAAQSIYKCTVGGKVAYGDRPCAAGESAELTVPAAPAPDQEAGRRLAHQKALLARLQKEREARQAADARTSARAGKAAAQDARRCAKLRLRQHWLDEDLAKAMSEQREALRRKAQRHRQAMALECPG